MKTRASKIRLLIVVIIIAIGLGIRPFVLQHTQPKPPPPSLLDIIDTTTHYMNLNDTVKYVGAYTCMFCHQSIFNSFEHTGMGESFDAATRKKSSAKFGKDVVIYDKDKDFDYHPFWKKDSLYVLEFRMKGKDTIYKREQQINYIIGSGQHTNSHIYDVNGYLFQAPITFYTQKGVWDLAPGFSDGFNSRFSREVGLECMNCHNSYPDFVKGSTNKFNSVPNGIACERCHGPGEMHVRAMQLGHRQDTVKDIDYTIVNPAKLSIELQMDVCQRCHLQGNSVLKPGKSFFDFKPGSKLANVEDVFMPKYKGMENEYIMASHIARLKMSQCYLQSLKRANNVIARKPSTLKPYKEGLTCVTCHNPHVDVRTVNDSTYNNTCMSCHHSLRYQDNINYRACTEDIHVRQKVKDNCVSCHMPKGGTIDIPHVITTDHYIRVPIKKEDEDKVKKFITLYDVNNPNPSPTTIGKAFIQQFASFQSDRPALLDSAKHYFSDKTPALIKKNIIGLIDISFYKLDYQKLLYYVIVSNPRYILDSILTHVDYNNADAWTAYRVGEAYYQTNDYGKAYTFYKKAVKLAPYVLEFQNKLGASMAKLMQYADAEKVFDNILTQNPQFVPALTNKGFLELKRGNADNAKKYYDKALALDPDDYQALTNTIAWYLFEKQPEKAKDYINQLVNKYPNDAMAKKLASMSL